MKFQFLAVKDHPEQIRNFDYKVFCNDRFIGSLTACLENENHSQTWYITAESCRISSFSMNRLHLHLNEAKNLVRNQLLNPANFSGFNKNDFLEFSRQLYRDRFQQSSSDRRAAQKRVKFQPSTEPMLMRYYGRGKSNDHEILLDGERQGFIMENRFFDTGCPSWQFDRLLYGNLGIQYYRSTPLSFRHSKAVIRHIATNPDCRKGLFDKEHAAGIIRPDPMMIELANFAYNQQQNQKALRNQRISP